MKIKQGQVFAVTTGEYSDYCLRGHFVALVDIDTADVIARFKDDGPYLAVPDWDNNGEPDAYGSEERFLAWIVSEGIAEEVSDVPEWYIGAYGRLEEPRD